jgi:hypothetical protein
MCCVRAEWESGTTHSVARWKWQLAAEIGIGIGQRLTADQRLHSPHQSLRWPGVWAEACERRSEVTAE